MEEQIPQVNPQHPWRRAAEYTLSEWECLVAFAGDGGLDIDYNAAERSLRGIALGRRNWHHVSNNLQKGFADQQTRRRPHPECPYELGNLLQRCRMFLQYELAHINRFLTDDQTLRRSVYLLIGMYDRQPSAVVSGQ